MELHYCPGPESDLSMNFFLAKQSHHLDGFPSSDPKTLSQTRTPVSCRICCRYCLIRSETQALGLNKVSHALRIRLHLLALFSHFLIHYRYSICSRIFLTYLLTHSKKQSPSLEANRFSPSYKIPYIL